jgi:transposase
MSLVMHAGGSRYCRRRTGEAFERRNIRGTKKAGGGKLMVWGCISWDGVGQIHRLRTKMNSQVYIQILEDHLIPSLSDQHLNLSRIIFQQDNDPKHTSKATMEWLCTHGAHVMPWAPYSPDMNIIEHVWDIVKRIVSAREDQPKNLEELWQAVQEAWYGIDVEVIRDLYRSLPRRVQVLKEAQGGYTDY